MTTPLPSTAMDSSGSGLKSIFARAIEIADPAERAEFLTKNCGADDVLRRNVDSLIAAYENAGRFMQSPAARRKALAESASGPDCGTVIAGRYRLVEELAEGGMGTVWLAEQTEPVSRRVAIKLIKPGMDSRLVMSRFEAERQALALMDHPNIAKVLDGGVDAAGRPFFVMEYVRGWPITEYSDQATLNLDDRLALFVHVCHAVQHAHQKGILHRDLKPSNILVCSYDGRPVPKVIDFGLAKAMFHPLGQHTIYSAHGLMLGTPLYMSPEQAESNNLDIDTRTDVYALGVILYELVTGGTPLDKEMLKDASWQEILRLVKEEEPCKPSVRLSTSDQLPRIASKRGMQPAELKRAVRGDLDWIVMKALEKDRERRYSTAAALAQDIERCLRHEPVEAHAPSAGYLLRKFARRNRRILTTAVLVSLALCGGLVLSTWQAIRATQAERRAEIALAAEAEQRKVADRQRNEAEQRRARAEASLQAARSAVEDYFDTINHSKLLNAPESHAQRNELLQSMLAYYLRLISQYGDDPAVREDLAAAYIRVGDLMVSANGSREQTVLVLSKGAELYEQLVRRQSAVSQHQTNLAIAYNLLGSAQQTIGQLAGAETSYRRVLAIEDQLAPDLANSTEHRLNLARACARLCDLLTTQVRLPEAEIVCRRALAIYEKVPLENQGDDFPGDQAEAWYHLGHVLRAKGELTEAETAYRHAIDSFERLARGDPDRTRFLLGVAGGMYNLGHVHRLAGQRPAAAASYQRALEAYEKLTESNPTVGLHVMGVARANFHIGLILAAGGQQDEARSRWNRAVEGFESASRLGYPSRQTSSALAEALAMLGRWREAAQSCARTVAAGDDGWRSRCQLASLQCAADDDTGYQSTCADLLRSSVDRFAREQAMAVTWACVLGPLAASDAAKVVNIAEQAAAAKTDVVGHILVSIARARVGDTEAAIAALEAIQSRDDVEPALAATSSDQRRAARLLAASVLLAAYRDDRADAATQQTQLLRTLVEQTAAMPPEFAEGVDRWILPLALDLAQRELERSPLVAGR
ncbi:MAG TPA: protein kinase [Pirellulales bacterium]|nr:protein kinase [Pirellulales bacterium]